MEDDVRGLALLLRSLEPPTLQRDEQRVVGDDGRRGADPELGQEPARFRRPRERQVTPRPRDPDVEQSPLLRDLVVRLRALRGQLARVEPGEKDRVELEPLGAVIRQQVNASGRTARKPRPQVRDELRDRSGVARKRDEQLQVLLSRLLALADPLRRRCQQPVLERYAPHLVVRCELVAAAQHLQELPRGVALEERRALEGDLRLGERRLEVGRARVQPVQDGHPVVWDTVGVQRANSLDDELELVGQRRERPRHGLGAALADRPQGLRRPAELRDEPVRELEHLGRRAVVRLEPNDGGVRIAIGQLEQVARRRSGERVDRLVVVADGADVVALAEPELEQRLLEQVHVLVLVDGERPVACLHDTERVRVALVQLDRTSEQILEVHRAALLLAAFVVAEHALHQLRRDRRLVLAETVEVRLRRQSSVLGPLDLGREVCCGRELVRHRQRVADRAERQHLRGEDLQVRHLPEERELRECRGVEGRRAHALDPQRSEPCSHRARRLVGERDREDLLGDERSGRDLVRDPVGDRGRLPRACPGQDADRPADRLCGPPLLRVQPPEDLLLVHQDVQP